MIDTDPPVRAQIVPMSAEETPEKQQSAPGKIVVDYATAVKAFASPQVDFGLNLPADFQAEMRALGQIYDVLQRFLIGDHRRTERYYPTTEELYSDLQLLKRTVGDKIPMPTEAEFRRLLRQLATTDPPFIHCLRELAMGRSGIEVLSLYTAPTEKHPDKVLVGYQSALRNSSNVLKDLLYGTALFSSWDERLKTLKNLSDLDLRQSRVDSFLKLLYIHDPAIPPADFDERLRLKKVNEAINRYSFRPLIQQLYRDKMVVSYSCKEIRALSNPGMDKYSDVLLFNNPEQIQKRYFDIRQILDSHLCQDYMDRGFVDNLRARMTREEISQEDFYFELAGHVIQEVTRGQTVNMDLFDLAVEVQKLSEWNRAHEKKHREDTEKNELAAMIEAVRKHGDLVRVNPRRNPAFKDRHLKLVLTGRMPTLFWATEPPYRPVPGQEPNPHDFEHIFLLYKDRANTGAAIQSALKLYDQTGDTYLVLLLERMLGLDETPAAELKKHIPPVFLDRLHATVNRTYAGHLPFLLRLWYTLTSTEITAEKVRSIKQRLKKQEAARVIELRQEHEEREQKSARQKVKSVARGRIQEEDRVLDALNLTIELINGHWARGHFPARIDVIDSAPEEQREPVTKVLGLVDAGAASVRAIRKIRLPSQTDIYAGEEFLKEHRDPIVRFCERHGGEGHVAITDGVARTLHDPSSKRANSVYSPEDYRAVLREVQTV